MPLLIAGNGLVSQVLLVKQNDRLANVGLTGKRF